MATTSQEKTTETPKVTEAHVSEQTTQENANQQYFAQPSAAPVQYVVMANSLKGVKGWLAFLTVLMGFGGIIYTLMFFGAVLRLSSPEGAVSIIFAPIIAILSFTTVVLISLQKKVGRYLAIAAYMTSATYFTLLQIVIASMRKDSDAERIVGIIGGIFIYFIVAGLLSLYFVVSKRVKETLID
jgi:hypothetical protein